MDHETIIDVSKVSAKGQVVIPKAIRDKFDLKEGSKLIVVGSADAVVLWRIDTVVGRAKTQQVLDRVRWLAGRIGISHE